MKRAWLCILFLPVALVVGLVGGLGLLLGEGLGHVVAGQGATGPTTDGGPAGPTSIPIGMLRLYEAAASTCSGLSWTVLTAIGAVESDHGRSNLPGVQSGRSRAGAEGPMQFEPATFAAYAFPVPPGGARPPSPYDPTDSVYAAARLLCAAGASDPARLVDAVYQYNHSTTYVDEVLARAASFGSGFPSGELIGSDPGLVAEQFALAQVGTPYRWGGESPGVAFDCSGLVQAAWAAAGVALPRVAQAQFDVGPEVPDGQALAPGDLVFFGAGPGRVTHVGLVVDPRGVMVDAPHPGTDVRTDVFPLGIGAPWGNETYLGSTAPGS